MKEPSLYFTNNGLHTHLLLPSAEVNTRVSALGAYFPDASWLQIGWGTMHTTAILNRQNGWG